MKRKRKFIVKMLFGFILVVITLLVVNFIPAWNLESKEMTVMQGDWVNVYYETESEAAKDVFLYADSETAVIADKLGFEEKQDVNIYLFDNQESMQRKKYGYIASLLGLSWYIGDNIGTNVILTSPANPGELHSYDSVRNAVIHEIVHAYISVMNSDIDLWLTEGMALYLSNGEPFYKRYLEEGLPSYRDTCFNNPILFSMCDGYTYAHTYIEYIDDTYGWDKVLELIKTEDYERCFGESKEEIYHKWVNYIENYYQ